MRRTPFIIIEGRQFRWKEIVELRRTQLAARAAEPTQLTLFSDLREDYRPADARTASGRFQQPGLFESGI